MAPPGFSGSGIVKYFSTRKSNVGESPLSRPMPPLFKTSIVRGLWASSSNVSANCTTYYRHVMEYNSRTHLLELEQPEWQGRTQVPPCNLWWQCKGKWHRIWGIFSAHLISPASNAHLTAHIVHKTTGMVQEYQRDQICWRHMQTNNIVSMSPRYWAKLEEWMAGRCSSREEVVQVFAAKRKSNSVTIK